MYGDVMRTQVTLGKEELELLDRAAKASGASRSELIRRAIHRAYGTGSNLLTTNVRHFPMFPDLQPPY